jgi:oligopeptide transport system permease protein
VQIERSRGRLACGLAPFPGDRVGLVSLVVVAAVPAADALAAAGPGGQPDWQKEVGVPNAAPTFIGPASLPRPSGDPGAQGPERGPVGRRPAGAALRSGTSAPPSSETEARSSAETLPMGGDRFGRDVLAKAIKGAQISVFVGVLAALVATLIGTLLGACGLLRRRWATCWSGSTTCSPPSRASC